MNWTDLVEKARERTPCAVYGNGILVVPARIWSDLRDCARYLRAHYEQISTVRGEYELIIEKKARSAWSYVVDESAPIQWMEMTRLKNNWTLRQTKTGHLIALKPGRRAFVLTTQRVVKRFVYRAPRGDVEKNINCNGVWAEVVDPVNGLYAVWAGEW